MKLNIRLFEARDINRVLAIEEHSFGDSWHIRDFLNRQNTFDHILRVIECGDLVVGYIVYQMLMDSIEIQRLAVDCDWRRRGVGTQLVTDLCGKITAIRRDCITMDVRETNLAGQCFLRSCGFRAMATLIQPFLPRCDEDAYLFRYSHQPAPVNRIRRYLENA